MTHSSISDWLRIRHMWFFSGETSNILSLSEQSVIDGNAVAVITPNVQVIGLSFHEPSTMKEDMLRAGASVYITKYEASEKLCAAIRKEGAQKM